jgi:hypothetical protein
VELELIVLGPARFAVVSGHLGTAVGLGASPIGPAPAQTCLPNSGLVSLVAVAFLQLADATRAVWP